MYSSTISTLWSVFLRSSAVPELAGGGLTGIEGAIGCAHHVAGRQVPKQKEKQLSAALNTITSYHKRINTHHTVKKRF
jgi:hypothetical protein